MASTTPDLNEKSEMQSSPEIASIKTAASGQPANAKRTSFWRRHNDTDAVVEKGSVDVEVKEQKPAVPSLPPVSFTQLFR